MCRQDLQEYFGFLTLFVFVLWFALTLTNMIFSIITPKEFDTFIEANYTADFRNTTNYKLLLDLNFGTELEIKYDYGLMGTIDEFCYIGICNLDSANKATKNCSDSCIKSTKYCYDGENRCNSKKCIASSRYNSNSSCHEFNRIQFWRNVEYFRNIDNYKVIPYYDIISKDQDCRYGYKKCGIINENKDYLCIKKGKFFDCPINDIIVKSNNESIEEGYRSFKLGDKFIFVSNEKIDNYIIKNISITLDINKTSSDLIKVDNDTYENFSTYNYIYLDSIDQPELAFLNAVPFKINFTYEEMMKKQGIIDKKKETYTKEKLYELNSEVQQYKILLFAFGIAIFCTLIAYIIFICSVLACECCKDFQGSSFFCPIIVFYLFGIPLIILLIYSFILTIKKKITYNKLSSMEYIEEYKNLLRLVSVNVGISYPSYRDKLIPYDFFENSITYNNVQFILLLISLILLILYPIVVLLFCRPPGKVKEKKIYSYNTTGVNGECSEMCSKPMNDQMDTPS